MNLLMSKLIEGTGRGVCKLPILLVFLEVGSRADFNLVLMEAVIQRQCSMWALPASRPVSRTGIEENRAAVIDGGNRVGGDVNNDDSKLNL
ncbi:MAG TPA: hypothetical protein VGO67_14980 [Verrucomicrobiae bacterium]